MFRCGLHLALWTLPLLVLSLAAPARATGQSDLTRAVEALGRSRGPEAYTHVRYIWQRWSDTDPALVERALEDASVSKRLPEGARAYASFLLAQAHTRRGDAAGARRAVAKLGFVSDWLVLGPFDNEGKTGFSVEFGPEAHLGEPIVPGRAYSGKERPVRWRAAPQVFGQGWLNGSSLFRPELKICFFATTFVANASSQPMDVAMFAGAAGAFTVFVNGTAVLTDTAYRGHDVDRRGVEVRLPKGTSNVTAKLCNDEVAPILSLRIVPKDGNAGKLTTSADFADGEKAVANHQNVQILRERIGPLDQFEDRVSGERPSAEELEAFARYLVATHGDDPTTHAARDYARRAADLEPTVARLLLAGETAEDYNQQRAWVERAEALAEKTGDHSVELTLARATVEQGGLNWRDAYAHFRAARQRDADDVRAIHGQVQLLNDAGLEFTALSILEEAVERNPNAVTLLNLLASQLRVVGRTQEAVEVEARYAQFRFDDNSYLSQRIELALARNNRSAAEHWIARLLDVNPDSLWAHSTAAQSYRRLGQSERAVQTYERALQLAPEDVQVMRLLADLRGVMGERDEQIALMQKILELQPQAKDAREYLSHIEPEAPQPDEALAWEPDRFLKRAQEPARGESRRTLLDLTVSTVFENGLSNQFRQVVFQPLVDSAAALSRNYSFQYQADSQRVRLRGARVFRADGSIDEAIETGIGAANDPSIAMYTSARTFNVEFPRLEPGDVVELRYRIDDVAARNEFNDYFGDIQYLQANEWLGHAEYVLITPKSRRFYIDHAGVPGLRRQTKVEGDKRIFRFWADSVPPILPEPKMPSWQEVAGFVHVSTYANYDELGKWYWGLVRDQFDLDDETRTLAREITQGLTSEREKVAAVYNWVIKNTRYVALEFGIYGFKPRRCVQTVSRGWGDCKDKATVIVSLLEELGIDATIVIVRTQHRGGFKSKVASLAPFDHAIAYVPSLDLYLDGTAEFTGSTELPEMDQGSLAIRINGGNPVVVHLPRTTPEQTVRSRVVQARVSADGSAKLALDYEVRGTQAPTWRRRYGAAGTRRERVSTDLSHEFPGLELLPGDAGLQVALDDFESPVKVHVEGTAPSFARVEAGDLSLPVTTRTRLLDDFAALSQRKLDVDIGAFGSVEDRVTVSVPPGHRVKTTPPELHLDTRFGSFSVKVERGPNTVTVHSRIAVKVSRVTPADYQGWRAFCQAVDSAMNTRLIITKGAS